MGAALRFDRLDHKGEAVAQTETGPVRAGFFLPGETAEGRVGDGRLLEAKLLKAAPERVAPICPHFGACGGCALQHGSDAFIAGWKTGMLRDALARRGLETEIRPILTCAPGARRRAAFSARRLKKSAIIGFHGARDAGIVPLERCPVCAPEIEAVFPALREAARLICSRKGEGRIAVTLSEAGLDLALEGARELDAALRGALADLAERMDAARLSYGGETVAMRRPPFHRVGAARMVPPPGGFLQAAAAAEEALAMDAAETVGDAARIVDLFSGAGAFALRLAARAEVHAAEADGAALAALDAAWRRGESLRAVTTERRDLFRRPLRAEELNRFDAAVLDPPRQGAAAQIAELARSGLTRLAYISCDPETFARDASALAEAGWRLDRARPVDQFRWSPHLEVAAAFSR